MDIDRRAVHMAYIQFALLHIPAVILDGNTLSLEFRDVWKTPAHFLGDWDARFKIADQIEQNKALSSSAAASVPTPVLDSEERPKRDYAVEKTGQIRLV